MTSQRQLLLLSSSKIPADGTWMNYAAPTVGAFLHSRAQPVTHIAFVPYAGVTVTADQYIGIARSVFTDRLGFRISSVHATRDPAALLAEADAIVVGGGNTNVLNATLHDKALTPVIRNRVLRDGVPYIGWSAGAVIAFADMRTTNDMNIIGAPNFSALGLISGPARLNAHYADSFAFDTFSPDIQTRIEALLRDEPRLVPMWCSRGETRADRIAEYLAVPENQGPVIGLYEGGILAVEGATMRLQGVAGAKIFRKGQAPELYAPGADLSDLLK